MYQFLWNNIKLHNEIHKMKFLLEPTCLSPITSDPFESHFLYQGYKIIDLVFINFLNLQF